MGTSRIEWTEQVWNPLVGCTRVSEGCRHCYAETMARRLQAMGVAGYEGVIRNGKWSGNVNLVVKRLDEPLRRRRPTVYFVDSMGDLFHEKVRGVWIDQVFAVMAVASWHRFIVLTKRPERMRSYMDLTTDNREEAIGAAALLLSDGRHHGLIELPLPNVMLGVSAEDQATWDARVPVLVETPAALRCVSVEPLLGPVDVGPVLEKPVSGTSRSGTRSLEPDTGFSGLDWVIVGGESGPKARMLQVAWVQGIVDGCRAAGVPVFVKQDSGPWPGRQGELPDDLWAMKQGPRWNLELRKSGGSGEGSGRDE